MVAPGVLLTGLAASILWLAVFSPPATAQSFLDIAASVRDRPVPRPKPNTVPEFILIAEMANQNRRTSPRPTGGVPDFVLIGESVSHGSDTGVGHPGLPEVVSTTSEFVVPNWMPPTPTTRLPLVITDKPDVIHVNEFTRPDQEVVTPAPIPVSQMMPDETSTSAEDFDEDKIYFEEWDKKLGDPR